MRKRMVSLVLAVGAILGMGVVAIAFPDFGMHVQRELSEQSEELFGVGRPLQASSASQITKEDALAQPQRLLTLANGLKARAVTSGVAPAILDMIALWPDDRHPEWLIECNESGPSDPGLIRINIKTGGVATILTGTQSCDPVKITPWGTIVFAEEAGGGPTGGSLYELSDPVGTTGVTLDRVTHSFSGGVGAGNFAYRASLGHLSFEGIGIYDNGVVYYGDENRPSKGTPGGAMFKFIPSSPPPQGARITSLDDSPLKDGSIYGLRLGLRAGGTDYGQGTQFGFGTWVQVCASPACPEADLRAQAATLKLTGYYRPEDAEADPVQEAAGNVRVCWTNTGNEENDQLWGEALCLTDGTLSQSAGNAAVPEVQPLVQGNPALAMPDNVAFQPGRNNLIVHEDADTNYLQPHNNDLWDCLPDGADDNLQSDGCVRIGTLNDLTAEWTGGIFDATGKRFFVSVQHNISGFGTVFEITGWDQ